MKLARLDVGRMAHESPPPIPWVIKGLVVKGALTVLNGREGEGKSLLAMALAAGVSLGEDEAGFACCAGSVLVIDAENGPHEIHRRVHTLGLPATVSLYEPSEGQRFDLRTDLHELEAVVAKHRPDLLVIDAFRSLWGGEENDSREVASVLDPLRNLVRRYGAGTLLLHHSGKSTAASYRGSSAIGASAELGFTLGRQDGDDDHARRRLDCWKCRPAPRPDTRWLRLNVERGQVFIDEAEPATEAPPAATQPVRAELRPQVLAALTDEPQTRADLARAVGKDPKDRSVGRVLDTLREEGLATKTEGRWRRVASGNPLSTAATLPPPITQNGKHRDDPYFAGATVRYCECGDLATPEDEDGTPWCVNDGCQRPILERGAAA